MKAQAPVWWKLGRPRGFSRLDTHLAACWLTCAVGEQAALYPKVVVMLPTFNCHQPWEPRDHDLALLGGGGGFLGAVAANAPGRALQCLDDIEDRVLELKRRAL